MADKFVRARVLRITGIDLKHFEFDLDLTWTAFFVNADGHIYGRYGGRDAKDADARNSLEGLKYALESALAEHAKNPRLAPVKNGEPLFIEQTKLGRLAKGCIHCHQAKEILRQTDIDAGKWDPESRWSFPLPENVGITLDVDKGDLVQKVIPDSPAAKIGIKPGDIIAKVREVPIRSFGDFAYALHKTPANANAIPIAWSSAGQPRTGTLTVAGKWKFTNLTWRPSLLDLLPSLTVYGEDLSAAEKGKLGLEANALAFRQDTPVHSRAQAMGVRAGDVIVGVDDRRLSLTVDQFLAYVRQNYLNGDRMTLNVIRDGKRVDLPTTLK